MPPTISSSHGYLTSDQQAINQRFPRTLLLGSGKSVDYRFITRLLKDVSQQPDGYAGLVRYVTRGSERPCPLQCIACPCSTFALNPSF